MLCIYIYIMYIYTYYVYIYIYMLCIYIYIYIYYVYNMYIYIMGIYKSPEIDEVIPPVYPVTMGIVMFVVVKTPQQNSS